MRTPGCLGAAVLGGPGPPSPDPARAAPDPRPAGTPDPQYLELNKIVEHLHAREDGYRTQLRVSTSLAGTETTTARGLASPRSAAADPCTSPVQVLQDQLDASLMDRKKALRKLKGSLVRQARMGQSGLVPAAALALALRCPVGLVPVWGDARGPAPVALPFPHLILIPPLSDGAGELCTAGGRRSSAAARSHGAAGV